MANLIDNKILEKKAIDEIIIDKDIIEKREILNNWIRMYENGTLEILNEKRLQGEFLNDIFSKLLGAINVTEGKEEYNLTREMKTKIDGQKADGVLGYFTKESDDVRAVIELKGPNVNLDTKQKRESDNRTAIEQAFGYVPKYGKNISWVIVSNYKEIRLYRANYMLDYQVFYLKDLKDDIEFKKFIYLLSFDSLIKREDNKSNTEKLAEDYQIEQKRIEKQFYNEYKEIRLKIYENIKKNNKEIRNEIIVEKVQKLLDRFLFIAFCEDKGLLPFNSYNKVIQRGEILGDTFESFKMLCNWINIGNAKNGINKYNGGLFKSDEILDTLIIDDEVFKELEKISNYDFASTLNEEILGHVFEKSISDIEELKNKKEDKRKKDGIFYTPKYITRYIVRKTIDNWIEDRKRELGGEDKLPELKEKNNKKADIKKHIEFYKGLRDRIRKIKIIDPACGSGAFLLTAFEYLYEINKNIEEILSKIEPTINIFDELEKDILQNNIYGVDLNNESVEITKLSLWLKTADVKKTLVSLDRNIKSGNSLIEDGTIDIKAFKWQEEFKEVFEDGGFDIVIGNPPYVRQEKIKNKKALEIYESYNGTSDLYCYFYEKAIKILKENGIFGLITSNKWLKVSYGKNIRKFLNEYYIYEIVDYGNKKVFEDAGVDTNIIIVKKEKKQNEEVRVSLEEKKENLIVSQKEFREEGFLFLDNRLLKIKEKIEKLGTPLKEWDINIYRGILTGLNEAFIINKEKYEELIKKDRKNKEILVPILRGRDIRRYEINYREIYLINTHNGDKTKKAINIEDYPYIKEYLDSFEPQLSKRTDKGKTKYNLRNCAYLEEFYKEKIVYPVMSNETSFYYDINKYFISSMEYIIVGDNLKYLIVLLNSTLIEKIYKIFYNKHTFGGVLYTKYSMEELPIIKPTFSQQKEVEEMADKLILLKAKIKNLDEIYNLAKNDKNYEKQLEIEKVKKNKLDEILDLEYLINKFVYRLYNLSEDEIRIIENF